MGAWVTGPDSLPLFLRPVVEGRARLTRSPWAGVRQAGPRLGWRQDLTSGFSCNLRQVI